MFETRPLAYAAGNIDEVSLSPFPGGHCCRRAIRLVFIERSGGSICDGLALARVVEPWLGRPCHNDRSRCGRQLGPRRFSDWPVAERITLGFFNYTWHWY
jgi:hypothetical protein